MHLLQVQHLTFVLHLESRKSVVYICCRPSGDRTPSDICPLHQNIRHSRSLPAVAGCHPAFPDQPEFCASCNYIPSQDVSKALNHKSDCRSSPSCPFVSRGTEPVNLALLIGHPMYEDKKIISSSLLVITALSVSPLFLNRRMDISSTDVLPQAGLSPHGRLASALSKIPCMYLQ